MYVLWFAMQVDTANGASLLHTNTGIRTQGQPKYYVPEPTWYCTSPLSIYSHSQKLWPDNNTCYYNHYSHSHSSHHKCIAMGYWYHTTDYLLDVWPFSCMIWLIIRRMPNMSIIYFLPPILQRSINHFNTLVEHKCFTVLITGNWY